MVKPIIKFDEKVFLLPYLHNIHYAFIRFPNFPSDSVRPTDNIAGDD